MKEGIYKSIDNPDLGLFRITKCNRHWIMFACTESGYPNSASSPISNKQLKYYEFVKKCEEDV